MTTPVRPAKGWEIVDILLDLIIGSTAWFYGVYQVWQGNIQLGVLCLVLAFVVEHTLGTKMVRKGLIKEGT